MRELNSTNTGGYHFWLSFKYFQVVISPWRFLDVHRTSLLGNLYKVVSLLPYLLLPAGALLQVNSSPLSYCYLIHLHVIYILAISATRRLCWPLFLVFITTTEPHTRTKLYSMLVRTPSCRRTVGGQMPAGSLSSWQMGNPWGNVYLIFCCTCKVIYQSFWVDWKSIRSNLS